MPEEPQKPLEQIVTEVRRFPADAFLWVQEGIGTASEQVHGPISPGELTVGQWMERNDLDLAGLRQRHAAGDLPADVAAVVDQLGGPDQLNRHVTGQQLCWALRDAALQRWGMMAQDVLARWNITQTDDIGTIIFALVENHWLQKQPADRIEDFANVFSFTEAFAEGYQIKPE